MKRSLLTLSVFTLALMASSANAALVHEYLFDTDASDTAGVAHGALEGSATVSGGKLVLAGTGNSTSFVELPSGIASAAAAGGNSGEISIETCINLTSSNDWRVIFSFGNNGDDANGGAGDGDYWQLIPDTGNAADTFRSTTHRGDVGEIPVDAAAKLLIGEQLHIVNVLNKSANTNTVYLNGVMVATGEIHADFDPNDYGPDTIDPESDTRNFLGRSQWDSDGDIEASYEDFRIYDTALSGAEVTALHAASCAIPEPATLALLALASVALLTTRRQSSKS